MFFTLIKNFQSLCELFRLLVIGIQGRLCEMRRFAVFKPNKQYEARIQMASSVHIDNSLLFVEEDFRYLTRI